VPVIQASACVGIATATTSVVAASPPRSFGLAVYADKLEFTTQLTMPLIDGALARPRAMVGPKRARKGAGDARDAFAERLAGRAGGDGRSDNRAK
jgi:hypothetical protein